jgi:hypothetical protein
VAAERHAPDARGLVPEGADAAPIYWQGMLKGHEWMAAPHEIGKAA